MCRWGSVQVVKAPMSRVRENHGRKGKRGRMMFNVKCQGKTAVGGGNKVYGDKSIHAWATKGCGDRNVREKARIEFFGTCCR